MHPGDVLGRRFELEQRVGSGGMGEVFRARDRASDEAVAVKVLRAGQEPSHRRFLREAEVLKDLSHPGIVRYVAHGEAPSGEPYLAMEWLAGEDLASRLSRGPLTVEETMAVGVQAALALTVAHARGVVHRDLKPSNLFLKEREVGQLRLLDFGIARRLYATALTEQGAVVGTPGYMAPEQVLTGEEVDARADVFALGCVLFECVTGTAPFAGAHLMAVMAKILFEPTPRAIERKADVPPGLDALLARMLAKKPGERPGDMAAVLAALSTAEAAGGSSVEALREAATARGGARTLLGKPTTCVGRDRELGRLEGALARAVEEQSAQAVVVTGPAGIGKSCVAHELMRWARRRGDGTAIWIGRADAQGTGSTLGLLSQVLRSALGIHEGEPLEARRDKILARVGEHGVAANHPRVARFLGEMVGTPFAAEESVELEAARQNAELMNDQMRWAWLDFLRAESAAHPVLLVLEDLHRGDVSTVRFVGAALREVSDQPWMALALGRPEVHALFPRLWAQHQAQEIRLQELSRRASEGGLQALLSSVLEPSARLPALAGAWLD